MAYVQKREADEEQQGQPAANALDRTGGAGVLGGDVTANGNVNAAPAPTNSGSHFVNLQRYLEQNPMTDVSGKIGGLTDKTIGSAMGDYTKGTEGLRGWVANDSDASSKRYTPEEIKKLVEESTNDPSKGFQLSNVLQNKQAWDDPGDSSYQPSDNLKRIAAIIGHPYTPRNSMVYDDKGQPTGKAVSSLPYELAQDKQIYTPGQEALDISLLSSKGDVQGAIKKGQDQLTQTTNDITKGVSDLNTQASNIRTGFKDQSSEARQAALKAFQNNLPGLDGSGPPADFANKGEFNSSNNDNWRNLAKLLGIDFNDEVSKYSAQHPRPAASDDVSLGQNGQLNPTAEPSKPVNGPFYVGNTTFYTNQYGQRCDAQGNLI